MLLAPPWVLFGGATDSKRFVDGNPPVLQPSPHLAPGVHVRVLPSPLIGLPATPLFVSRFGSIGDGLPGLTFRNDIRWVTGNGTQLSMPFDVETSPITGYLPPGHRCIWISVNVTISPIVENGGPVALGPSEPGFEIEARAATPDGYRIVGALQSGPFIFAGPSVDQIVIKLNATDIAVTVDSVGWIAAEDVQLSRFAPWRTWSLPVAPAPRYSPLPTALADADARVIAGAPPHRPLFTDPVAGGPSASPVQTTAEETARINRLNQIVGPMLNRLVSDLSLPPAQLREDHTFTDPQLSGTAGIPLLGHVIQSGVDPSMARWLGFADVDAAPPVGQTDDVALYLVRGLWAEDPSRSVEDRALLSALAPALVRPGPALLASFPQLATLSNLPSEPRRFYDLGVILAATIGRPSDRPKSPASDGPIDLGWRPDLVVPEARRMLEFPVSGLQPAAEIAFAVDDTGSSASRPLNPRLGADRIVRPGEPGYAQALPMPLAASPAAGAPRDTGVFNDRDGSEFGGAYRIAQADWFGRWSEWTEMPVPARARTLPPAPVLELHYQAPTLDPADTSLQTGTFTVVVSVPRPKDLPAGGLLLQDLRLDMSVDGGPPTGSLFPLPSQAGTVGPVTLNPAPSATAPGLLRIQFTGPALAPAAKASVVFSGTWGDTGLRRSGPGSASRDVFDPRPVPPPALPTDLIYAQRPDARGQARVELPFPSGSPQVRIFYTTETTALRGLELLAAGGGPQAPDATAALAEIRAAAIGSPRAQAFGNRRSLLGYDMFENLTAGPFSPSASGLRFPHVLSGSLEGLALYRVISVAQSGVQSDFATSPLVAAMVPNFGPPPRPMLRAEFRPADEGGGVRLVVKVPAGPIAPFAFRVRRATQPYTDARQMLEVNFGRLAAVGTPPQSWLEAPPVVDDQGTTFSLIDPGPFVDWRRHFWAVEVQAGPPPGAPTSGSFVPDGEWSLTSAPTTLDVIPATPPAAPTSVTAQRIGPDVEVAIATAASGRVIGTRFGAFRLEVFRVVKGARGIVVPGSATQVSATDFTITDVGAPANVTYVARVVDPFGRPGSLTSSNSPV